ncbi:glutathione S-transferase family protein [Pseudovibrio sp. SPO723]|uniref:glutathione S-transferase family protein n=1 Tax=Nesiotobacter zosterae TaxID=392721 RepID=UPI0029C3866E|nr:glutathione S-transferase family protein [Pseudovibrio sp. SPO723]MDX5593840.1 glutathione S-transferase family protein [Pseudovibrio sp. SPO723]
MGKLVEGKWVTGEVGAAKEDGAFKRADAVCRDWIKADGSTKFAPEVGRYHLYVADACPWAHRTRIFRKLKGLEDAISLSVVDPYMGENGWWFSGKNGTDPDPINGFTYLHEVYTKGDSDYTGRVTVPVLWDKKLNVVVSNESSEIIRMLNSEFVGVAGNDIDFYPEHLREKIDELNAWIYPTINNGVYRSGFARSQEAYETAVSEVFQSLDRLEDILSSQRYLAGDTITEADWRLFATLLRFDAVYVCLFKTNLRRISDYPVISAYLRELYQWEGITETIHMENIKAHYFKSLRTINPFGIVAKGPDGIDFTAPHDRSQMPSQVARF